MSNTEEQYKAAVAESREIFRLKTIDYGTAWRILRPSSLTDQIFIKASRIRSIQEKGKMEINESIEGEFKAIINYSIMAMYQLEYPVSEGDYDLDNDALFDTYDELANQTRELMMKKNHDYGEAWREMRVSSITDLILMKLLRIKQIEENDGQTLISEGLKANYQDILNYSAFALILIEEGK